MFGAAASMGTKNTPSWSVWSVEEDFATRRQPGVTVGISTFVTTAFQTTGVVVDYLGPL